MTLSLNAKTQPSFYIFLMVLISFQTLNTSFHKAYLQLKVPLEISSDDPWVPLDLLHDLILMYGN